MGEPDLPAPTDFTVNKRMCTLLISRAAAWSLTVVTSSMMSRWMAGRAKIALKQSFFQSS